MKNKKPVMLGLSLMLTGSAVAPVFADTPEPAVSPATNSEHGAADSMTDEAAIAKASEFKTQYKALLDKQEVTDADNATINEALAAYKKLDPKVQAKLADAKDILDKQRAALDEAIANYNKLGKDFREKYADILSKNVKTIAVSDLDKINAALADYNSSNAETKEVLNADFTRLSGYKESLEKVKDFQEKYKAILAKDYNDITSKDSNAVLDAITAYNALSDVPRYLLSDAYNKLNNDRLKFIESQNDKKAAEDFLAKYKDLLNKGVDKVTNSDKQKIEDAINDYTHLTSAASDQLKAEGVLLQNMINKVNNLLPNGSSDAKADTKTPAKKELKGVKMSAKEFTVKYKDLLDKDPATVTKADKDILEQASLDFNAMEKADREALKDVKTKIENLLVAYKNLDAKADDKKVVDAFKAKYKDLLAKDIMKIGVADKNAITDAVNEFNKLTDSQKALLANEKVTLENDAKKVNELIDAEANVNKFKETYKALLEKDVNSITKDDIKTIKEALDNYDKLSSVEKNMLKDVKTKLDAFAAKAKIVQNEQVVSNPVKEFKEKYKDILSLPTTGNASITDSQLDKVNKALDDYEKLNDNDKVALRNEKDKLDQLKKLTIYRDKTKPDTGNTTTLAASVATLGFGGLSAIGVFLSKKFKR